MSQELLFYITLLFTAMISVVLGAYVFWKDSNNRVNQSWFLLCVFVATWSVTCVTSIFADNPRLALFGSRVSNISASFIPVVFSHFCIYLTASRVKRWVLFLGYINCLIFLSFGFSDLYIPSMKAISVFPYYATPGPLFVIYTAHFIGYIFYSEFILVKSLLLKPPSKKANQIRYVILATVLGFISGIMSFFPVYNIDIYPLTMHFVWVYAAIITYAILKHNLLDIRIAIQKGLLYSFLVGLMTVIYFVIVFTLGSTLQVLLGYDSLITVVVSFAVIALCFKPLERRIQNVLDQKIFKRTPELLERENHRLLRELEHQDRLRAIATLAAGMAHEIKNPLASIKTFADYLPSRYDDPGFREKFAKIVGKEIDRINQTVHQLLNFAKPSAAVSKPVNIHEILDETTHLLQAQLMSKNISVAKDYMEALGLLHTDPNQLKQVFLNIILNAIEALAHGGIISITTSQHPDERLVILIKDNGGGIASQHLNRVFDPFFTTKENGTGLGLSIAHRIISELGGKLTLHNSDKGLEVSVVL